MVEPVSYNAYELLEYENEYDAFNKVINPEFNYELEDNYEEYMNYKNEINEQLDYNPIWISNILRLQSELRLHYKLLHNDINKIYSLSSPDEDIDENEYYSFNEISLDKNLMISKIYLEIKFDEDVNINYLLCFLKTYNVSLILSSYIITQVNLLSGVCENIIKSSEILFEDNKILIELFDLTYFNYINLLNKNNIYDLYLTFIAFSSDSSHKLHFHNVKYKLYYKCYIDNQNDKNDKLINVDDYHYSSFHTIKHYYYNIDNNYKIFELRYPNIKDKCQLIILSFIDIEYDTYENSNQDRYIDLINILYNGEVLLEFNYDDLIRYKFYDTEFVILPFDIQLYDKGCLVDYLDYYNNKNIADINTYSVKNEIYIQLYLNDNISNKFIVSLTSYHIKKLCFYHTYDDDKLTTIVSYLS